MANCPALTAPRPISIIDTLSVIFSEDSMEKLVTLTVIANMCPTDTGDHPYTRVLCRNTFPRNDMSLCQEEPTGQECGWFYP
jgi:hypothetical protein